MGVGFEFRGLGITRVIIRGIGLSAWVSKDSVGVGVGVSVRVSFRVGIRVRFSQSSWSPFFSNLLE